MWKPKKKKKEKRNTRTYKHTHTRYCFFLFFSFFTRGRQSRDRRTSTFFFFFNWILYTDWIAHLASDPLAWIREGGGRSVKWEYTEGHHFTGLCEGAVLLLDTKICVLDDRVSATLPTLPAHRMETRERECKRRGFVIFLFWTLTVIKSAERMKSIQKGWRLHCGDP